MAQIFVFNATRSAVDIQVNGGAPVRVSGTGGGNGYAPPAAAIGRGNMAEPGRFGSGGNQVRLVREGGMMSQRFDLTIRSDVRPGLDLQLYLFSEHAVLVFEMGETVYTVSS